MGNSELICTGKGRIVSKDPNWLQAAWISAKMFALISYWNDFSLIPLGEVEFSEESCEIMENLNFQNWKRPQFDISEYAFNHVEKLRLHSTR